MTDFLVDSNILVYAVDIAAGSKHKIAKEAIKQSLARKGAVISIQNIVEFARVISEKSKVPLSTQEQTKLISDLKYSFKVVTYTPETISSALKISSNHNIHFFDALLVATMNENGIKHIITENVSDFKKIKWLTVLNPFERKN